MTEQEFFDACGHKGFSELKTEDGKTLRVLAYHIGQQDARLRVRISYSTTRAPPAWPGTGDPLGQQLARSPWSCPGAGRGHAGHAGERDQLCLRSI